jgi:hypothetical protein
MEGRDGISYIVNRSHPAVSAFTDRLGTDDRKLFELVLETLERTFPADALYADMASERPRVYLEENLTGKFMELAQCLLKAADTIDGGRARLLASLNYLEPFCQYPEITESIIKELSNAD